MPQLHQIDESNRSSHYYLTPDDKCFFFHEFTARKGYSFSPGNDFILNFKKSPTKRSEHQFHHKLTAIENATRWLREVFDNTEGAYSACTFVPIPPSKLADHPEYDDRMWQVVQGICKDREADARELIRQTASYEAAHLAGSGGGRIKPAELKALYQLDPSVPKGTVALFDDVLAAGCHFKAAKETILAAYPQVQVIGFFLARRVIPDLGADFDVL